VGARDLDSFAGLRALLVPSDRRRPIGGFRRRGHVAPFGVETAGRGRACGARRRRSRKRRSPKRWRGSCCAATGWCFRRLVTRETLLTPWRDILRVYRRLEARGEIRGGRFAGGFSGSSTRCRKRWGCCAACGARRPRGELVAVSGADPLNLVRDRDAGAVVAGVCDEPDPVSRRDPRRDQRGAGSPKGLPDGSRRAVPGGVTPEERERLNRRSCAGAWLPLVRTYLERPAPPLRPRQIDGDHRQVPVRREDLEAPLLLASKGVLVGKQTFQLRFGE